MPVLAILAVEVNDSTADTPAKLRQQKHMEHLKARTAD